MTVYRGVTFFHSETGTEGGHWGFQDEIHIHTMAEVVDGKCPWDGRTDCPAIMNYAKRPEGGSHWSYEGLHVLKTGDRLKIFSLDEPEKVVWEGEINLNPHPLFTEDAGGFWIHTDQVGMDRDKWAALFFKEHPAVLETSDGSNP